MAADGLFLLDEIDFEAAFGQIERGLHPGNAAAHNQNRTHWRLFSIGPSVKASAVMIVRGHYLIPYLGNNLALAG
jgi:hypothetical protein